MRAFRGGFLEKGGLESYLCLVITYPKYYF